MATTLLRWFVALVAVVGLAALAGLRVAHPERTPITSDGFEYYAYLPDWFLFHDTSFQAVADDCCGGRFPEWSAMKRSPRTGRWLNPHPIGVAVLSAPAFAVAHGLTLWSGLPPDGFSLYYQVGASLAGLAFMLAGLAILRRLLHAHFSDGVALATLAVITFGTNLFHYGVFDATYSHAFSFALVCALMALAEHWWDSPRLGRSLALGLVAGLIVLVRHPNALVLLVVPLFGLEAWSQVPERLRRLKQRRWHLLAAAACAVLVLAPQAALYRVANGGWTLNSYALANGSFEFLASPRIGGVLFSVQKGLFFWSPALLLALAGFLVSRPGSLAGRWRLAALVVLALQTYVLASWSDWQLGGSFGHRGFTDVLGLMAPFVAAAFSWAWARKRWARTAAATFATASVVLSAFLMIEYWRGAVPIADTTLEQYARLFLPWR